MKIDADFLHLQLEYSRWASERSLDAARGLTVDELSRDLGNSYGGVLGTLQHIFLADRVWLSRLRGNPRTTFKDPEEAWTLDEMAAAWAKVADEYSDWTATVADAEAILHYVNLQGKPGAIPLWQVILHIVNHASYHRGQITTMLRQLGKTPVSTDLHVFYLNRQTASSA
jgi:uncharacterized damage-inducible protein DinB